MKNFIFIALFMLLDLTTVFAQTEGTYAPLLSTTTGKTLDTAVNTTAKSQVLRIPGGVAMLSIQATVTKISGTAAGTVKLYGSLDGIAYAEINSSNSFTVTDVTPAQAYVWHVLPSQYTYYKTIFTPTGTMAAQIKVGSLRR